MLMTTQHGLFIYLDQERIIKRLTLHHEYNKRTTAEGITVAERGLPKKDWLW